MDESCYENNNFKSKILRFEINDKRIGRKLQDSYVRLSKLNRKLVVGGYRLTRNFFFFYVRTLKGNDFTSRGVIISIFNEN